VRGRLKGKKKEYFLVLLLDTRGQLIKTAEISVGSLDSSVVHPREVFRKAVINSAYAIITAHNHPSGHPKPSDEDRKIWDRINKGGDILGIHVLDHIIITPKGYYYSAKNTNEID
jgi:DNA repair protein RadC